MRYFIVENLFGENNGFDPFDPKKDKESIHT